MTRKTKKEDKGKGIIAKTREQLYTTEIDKKRNKKNSDQGRQKDRTKKKNSERNKDKDKGRNKY